MSQDAPLTPAVFHILLALSAGEKHGYDIMKQVHEDSHGTVRMGTGTLYGSLKRMLAAGLIEETGDRVIPGEGDERRRYYRSTELGTKEFTAELRRYRSALSIARRRAATPAGEVR